MSCNAIGIKVYMCVGLLVLSLHPVDLPRSGLHANDALLVGGATVLRPKAAMLQRLCITCRPSSLYMTCMSHRSPRLRQV